jgi:hypothetical protein
LSMVTLDFRILATPGQRVFSNQSSLVCPHPTVAACRTTRVSLQAHCMVIRRGISYNENQFHGQRVKNIDTDQILQSSSS